VGIDKALAFANPSTKPTGQITDRPEGQRRCGYCGSRVYGPSGRANPMSARSDQYKAIKQVEKRAGVSFGVAASSYSASGGNLKKAIATAKGLRAKNPGASSLVTGAISHTSAGRKAIVAVKKFLTKKNPRSKNPLAEAEEMFELFHGMPANEIIEIVERVHVHSKLWNAGTLTSMIVQTETGKEITLNAPDPDSAKESDVVYVAFNEAGNQIYFRGGNQSIPKSLLVSKCNFKDDDFRDNMLIGWVVELTYRAKKKFEKDGQELVDFYHALGKEHSRGVLPMLVYTPTDELMAMYGGRYKVLPKRFDIGASPGIGG
jgi:hypothetical protein